MKQPEAAEPTNVSPEAETAFQRTRIITLAFMAAVGVYFITAVQLDMAGVKTGPDPGSGALWILRGALGFLSVACQLVVERIAVLDPSAVPQDAPAVEAQTERIQRAEKRAILRAAVTEAIAIYGLLVFLLGGTLFDTALFAAAALILFGVRFPTRHRWAREVSPATG